MTRSRILSISAALAFLLGGPSVEPHNVGDAVLWNREISRIFYQRCVSCHREDGTAFSLMTFREAQPHAAAIKDSVLSRRMPPWGAVKGFGDFRNDQALSQEEIGLITDWVDSDTPRGNNPSVMPKEPKFSKTSPFKVPKNAILATGTLTLKSALVLDGLFPDQVPAGNTIRITAKLPDGHVEPLLWLYDYKNSAAHPFLFRKGLNLPSGTVIQGVPQNARVFLIPGKS